MFLLDYLRGEIVRDGDEVTVYGNTYTRVGKAKIYGWGGNATAYVAGTLAPRYEIVKGADGKWTYTIEGA